MSEKDIVERLKSHNFDTCRNWVFNIDLAEKLIEESATEIEILRTREREAQDRYKATEDELRATETRLASVERRNVELEEALKPFAKAAEGILPSEDDAEIFDADDFPFLQVGHFRAAIHALQSQETDDGR